MNKFNKFAAAAAAFALAAASTGCSAPEAITFGKGSQTALTIDGYEVPAGVFIYNELYAYNTASYQVYTENGGKEPSVEDVKNATIESMDATDWIQDKATQACKDFVANEKEFEKIGGQLTDDELAEIKEMLAANGSSAMFSENGVGEESLRKVIENNYKQTHIFEHYYGLGSEKGCTEDELKEYYQDKTARIKYFSISLVDDEGEKFDADETRRINNMIDDYIKEINAEKTNEAKLKKIDECEEDYNSYVEKRTAEAAAKAAEEAGETTTSTTTTTTTTTTGEKGATTTTTTADPHANEVTITKYSTTTADDSSSNNATTTTLSAEQEKTQKAQQDYNDYLFNKIALYKAEKYEYDENTVYIVIKADIKERMTSEDLWNDTTIDSLLSERYYSDFEDMMKEIVKGYDIKKNSTAYRKYSPFKLKLDIQ